MDAKDGFEMGKFLAGLFGPAGFVLVCTNLFFAWWAWKREGAHRDERGAWEKAARDERVALAEVHSLEHEAWTKRIDGFRQDIKDAFAQVGAISKDVDEAIEKLVETLTKLRIAVATRRGGEDE